MARGRSTATPALRTLDAAGVAYTVHAYDHDASAAKAVGGYGAEAAGTLGLDPEQVFKTLVLETDVGAATAIVPVSHQLDLKQAAAALGAKRATLIEPATAERLTGYVVGGISPLGQRTRLATVIDASAEGFATVYVSAGRRGLDVELAAADLVRLLDATVALIAR